MPMEVSSQRKTLCAICLCQAKNQGPLTQRTAVVIFGQDHQVEV